MFFFQYFFFYISFINVNFNFLQEKKREIKRLSTNKQQQQKYTKIYKLKFNQKKNYKLIKLLHKFKRKKEVSFNLIQK